MGTSHPARELRGPCGPGPDLTQGPGIYQPRRATRSPLYRIAQEHLESFLARDPDAASRPAPFAEDSMRSFLECGVPRFGVVRFRRPSCGDSLFVPYSCKRRGACPSCDWKRAVASGARFIEELLPRVPYRQWVLVMPKRLRWFVNSDPRLAGELCRIFSRVLTRFHAGSAGGKASPAAPALIEVIQRFGASVNLLHVHPHAVASDGVFTLCRGNRLRFVPSPEPTREDLGRLSEALRRKVLRRFVRLGVLPEDVARGMLRWAHSGFSLDASVRVGPDDRAAVERLPRYCLRPVISLKRLEYRPQQDLARYRPGKHKGTAAPLLEWTPVEFLGRFSRLIPPPRANLVRYAGALGPRSGLRSRLSEATRQETPYEDLLAGRTGGLHRALRPARKIAREARTAAQRAWAACIRRVFEVYPIRCEACGLDMVAVAAITDDRELERLLAHVGLPSGFPKTRPARAPPLPFGEDSQVDPAAGRWHGIDPEQPGEWTAA